MLLSLETYQKTFMKSMISNVAGAMPEAAKYVGPAKRFPVYQTHYQQVLLKSLTSCFANTLLVLGEQVFYMLANKYIVLYPSRCENLNQYGDDFSIFIGMELADSNAIQLPVAINWVKDLAHCEFLRQSCYYASNHQSFDVSYFISLNEEQQLACNINRQDSLKVQKSKYDLLSLKEMSTALKMPYMFYLHYREEGKVKLKEINEATFLLFKNLERPITISTLTESQIQLLPVFISQGWIKVSESTI